MEPLAIEASSKKSGLARHARAVCPSVDQPRLQDLIDDPLTAREMGRAAQDRATAIYGWDAIAQAYEAWLESLIGR